MIAPSRHLDLATHARVRLSRGLCWLLGVLLLLQVVAIRPLGGTLPADPKASAIAGLSAAIGQPVPICDHAGDPSHRGDPGSPHGCDHCIFCHVVASAVPTAPDTGAPARPPGHRVASGRPPLVALLARPRRTGASTPRGPPPLLG